MKNGFKASRIEKSLNVRNAVASQRAQLVRESDSLFRKRQIKTVVTNIVAEHAKSNIIESKATVSSSLNMLVNKTF